jgi:PTS system nitrogen regulatory IIA component
MGTETLDLDQLASLLGRDARELGKLANRGHLPGRKVGGKWRFATAEVHNWLEREMPRLSDHELKALDPATSADENPLLVSSLLRPECIDLSLPARTRDSVLRELVKLAEKSEKVWDPAEILEAIRAREAVATTAQPEGYAVPHPRRRIPNTLGDSVIAFARTGTGIPFGAERGATTDLFFLVCCNNDALHLQLLARLARLLRQPGLLDALRNALTPEEARYVIESAERELEE